MDQILFKKIPVMLLLFIIVGAFFFCAFAVTMPMNDGAHNMPLNQEKLAAHFSYVKELTLATIIKAFVASISFLFFMVFVVFAVLHKFSYFLQLITANYLKQKCRDVFYFVQSAIYNWLSSFERSPNFIKPA
ncbi:MAG: hypothetical protein Q7S81_00970 [bacterium]|nr:hypothetical protein [bacterium]